MRAMLHTKDIAPITNLEIAILIELGQPFTAFDVTKALRGQYPSYEIPHEQVRKQVHAIMEEIPGWTRHILASQGYSAWHYMPQTNQDAGDSHDGTTSDDVTAFIASMAAEDDLDVVPPTNDVSPTEQTHDNTIQ